MSNDPDGVDALVAARDDDVHALYERAPCGYLSTTPDGTIIKVNATLLAWTGHDRDDLVGRRRFVDLLTPGGRIFHETHHAPLLRMQRRAREIALDMICADGRRLPVLVNSVVESGPDGRDVVRSAIFDVTQRRMYERELLAAKDRAEQAGRRAAALAATLQRALVPPVLPPIAHLDVAATCRPAGCGEEIGGDFYDVFQIAADDWFAILGDVQGKGVDAALITLLLRHSARAAAVEHPMPSQVLRILNTVLLHDATERSCTAVAARLRREGGSWTITLACAGHPLPLLRRGAAPAVAIGTPGPLLGFFDEVACTDVVISCSSGDEIALYTDGVSEARREQEWFGESRILATLAVELPTAQDVAEELLARVLAFQAQVARDDIGIVIIRVP